MKRFLIVAALCTLSATCFIVAIGSFGIFAYALSLMPASDIWPLAAVAVASLAAILLTLIIVRAGPRQPGKRTLGSALLALIGD
jgi:hypothetical protein